MISVCVCAFGALWRGVARARRRGVQVHAANAAARDLQCEI